ncbi:type II toxin-antitoxin system RelE/ParE family toxin [Pantoea tagorei]
MPQVIVTQRAASGLARCREFLMNKNPLAALKAGQVLEKQFEQLEKTQKSADLLSKHLNYESS